MPSTAGRAARWAVAGAVTAVVGIASMLVTGPAAFGASGSGCSTGNSGVRIHFVAGPKAPPATITGVVVDGFEGCGGRTVKVTFSGNPAGNPQAAATELLAVYNSSLDPCSGAKLTHPVVISSGSVGLRGCATVTNRNAAGYPSLHDLTRVAVDVGGVDLTAQVSTPVTTRVLGEHFQHGANSATTTTSGLLPFTGSWTADIFWLGLLLCLAGMGITYAGRRRQQGLH